ncbi:SWIM zinc finger domain-containing protein [Paenibacillus chartarius]|uniref:SWIM zinc finger domain-containing protein n=1 Tax=Paenibacillus chartarius TaxID=747481 RepID=A0ABV6DVA8_9BACL
MIVTDELWSRLLKHVAESFNEVTLSRGFTYFKQKFVVDMQITDEHVIHAEVAGTDSYRVELRLDQLGSSSCTCPVQRSCKHIAAVIMELGDRFGYPAAQVVNAKQHLRRAAIPMPKEDELQLLPIQSAAEWHVFFQRATQHVKPAYDQSQYMNDLSVQLQRIADAPVPFTETDRLFFELHRMLFVARKMKEQSAQGSVPYYTSFSIYRLYDHIYEWIRKQANLIDMTASQERIRQTLNYMREQMRLTPDPKMFDFSVYTELWNEWVAPRPESGLLAAEELASMEKPEAPSTSLRTAQAYLHLCLGQPAEAWSALEPTLKQAPKSLLLTFLDRIRRNGSWELLVDWLQRTAAYFHLSRQHELDTYTGLWKEAVEQRPEAEPRMWSVLEDMLPHSLGLIEDLLYERHSWKMWLELQLVQGHGPLSHRVSVLQPIEKEAPELLLPYYHQAIEHYVGLKNRHEYKSAVKLMKRLEKVYKKMKQTERWQRYLTGFTERYGRLRALQEEMRKGKLLE